MLALLQYAVLLLAASSLTSAKPRLLPFKPFDDQSRPPHVCTPAHDDTADFLILGAGMSGLAAAHYLHAHTTNCTIRVVEARGVPGGRVRTTLDGPFKGMEQGAGWIHEYKGNPMLSVAHAMRVHTKWVGGDSSYVGGELIKVYDDGEELSEAAYNRSWDLMENLLDDIEDRVSMHIDSGLPDVSLLSTIHNLTANLGAEDKRFLRWHIDVIFGGDWGAPLANLSLLALEPGHLAYEGGDCVFPDGFGQIPSALAKGVDVRYGEVVSGVRWDGDIVQLVTDDGRSWNGSKVLLTASLGVQRSNALQFTPPLPKEKRATIDKFGMASLNRVMLRFPHAFWENDTYTFGFLPQSLFDEEDADGEWATEPVFSVAVVAAYEGREIDGGGAVLTFMIGGDSGEDILAHSDSAIVARVMRLLRCHFGASAVPAPRAFYISDWAAEPFARGVYAYLPVHTSVHTDVPALVAPVRGRLFWAGEATMRGASRGTTHGAFLSGVREAARMIGREEVVERVEGADEEDVRRLSAMEARRGARGIVVDDWFGAGAAFGEEVLCGSVGEDETRLIIQAPSY